MKMIFIFNTEIVGAGARTGDGVAIVRNFCIGTARGTAVNECRFHYHGAPMSERNAARPPRSCVATGRRSKRPGRSGVAVNAGLDLSGWVSPEHWSRERAATRESWLALRRRRRVELGPALYLTFENALTARYQLFEILRAENVRDRRRAEREAETYSLLVPQPGELRATLFVCADPPGDITTLPERLELRCGTRAVRGRALDDDVAEGVRYVAFDVRAFAGAPEELTLAGSGLRTVLSTNLRRELRNQ